MKEWKFIGFDLGAESSRCIAALLQDQKLMLEEVHRFPTFCEKNNTGFHWLVDRIFNEMLIGLTKAANQFGSDFSGISVDTWGVDYVLIDKDGNTLGSPYHYRDDRTDGMIEAAFKIVRKEELYKATGIQAAQYNTLFQLLAEKKNKDSLLNKADQILLMPDFLTYKLTGVKKAEFTIASTTNLTNPVTRNWAWDIIDAFNLPKEIFPVVEEPGCKAGSLLPYIAKKTGLNPATPVYLCASHDTASAFASVPAGSGNSVYLSSGTWSLLGVQQKEPVITAESLNSSFTNEGGVNGSTCLLKNIIGLWPLQECRREWLAEGHNYSYPELAKKASVNGFVNCWINLDDPRFLKAGNMPDKIKDFLAETGQQFKEEPGFITGVILESLAYCYRNAVENLMFVTGKKFTALNAVGGGINNELLTQYISDATGLPVYAGPVEGAVTGNIGIQAIASGAVANINEWHDVVKNSFEIKEYKPVNHNYFNANENRYNKIMDLNKNNL